MKSSCGLSTLTYLVARLERGSYLESRLLKSVYWVPDAGVMPQLLGTAATQYAPEIDLLGDMQIRQHGQRGAL